MFCSRKFSTAHPKHAVKHVDDSKVAVALVFTELGPRPIQSISCVVCMLFVCVCPLQWDPELCGLETSGLFGYNLVLKFLWVLCF